MLKYQQIAAEIEKYMEDHNLQQGDKLPVLETLMAQFEVSKSTITKSLDLLEKKGVIFQVRGSGIFVRRHKRKGYISLLSNQGFKKDLEDFNVTSKVIELDVRKPTKEAAENLNIGLDDDIYYVKRVRYINGQTLCFEESYYNKSIITYLNKEIVSDSIFNYIREGLGLKIGFSDLFLHVGQLNEEEARYLGLKTGLPKLYVESIFHLTNGQPFDFSRISYNYEQSQFVIQANSYG
ncbi:MULTISPECIES: GntR family transcriptional regulator [Bacillus]|uniref:GntR family transcriptional regulator n=2 Tax=Bacillus TaxID=1386 RepID=A0AAJ4D4I2_9BACI|nr:MULTISPECIES: GntR family transcriptional regulator [Bacillus]KKB74057.1 GntR family transcriptional regulator [Bacillus sp. TH008]MDU0070182.1 GntR family transcriptional regulator [Bacillus sp. IG6]MED8017884.1 GntR family transcriptional regulator [Bacillus glycinifermentans]QAT67663.1 GntR family transcriptional regulator [Bacillus glycinifermentans]WKB77325.1 GntR family transcriptional regulator [Bacillus glycinifermentans]